jgi:hypothetical protein
LPWKPSRCDSGFVVRGDGMRLVDDLDRHGASKVAAGQAATLDKRSS